MTHRELLNAATKAIIAVMADESVCNGVRLASLVELENLIHELRVHVEVFHRTD